MGARVALIDGAGLAWRAFYAMPGNLATTAGIRTGAAYGFAQMFRKLLAGRTPTLGAVIFDGPRNRESRLLIDPTYKANRGPTPPELREQLPLIERLIRAHNYPILRIPGVEADDVIATLCRQAVAAGHEVWVVSGDKDFAQLVTDRVRLFDATKEVLYDANLVRVKWGVTPEKFADRLALLGDPVDHVPGLPGIGPKTAAELLEHWGSVDAILANTAALKPKIGAVIEAHRAQLERNLALTRLDDAVPLPVGIEGLPIPPTDPAELNAVYRELEFFSLLSAEEVADVGARGEWFACDTPETAAAAIAAELAGPRPVALHVLVELTSRLGPPPAGPPGEAHHVGEIAGIAVSPHPGRALWFPGWQVLRPWLEDASRPKIVHQARTAIGALGRHGVALRGVVGDPALASYLLDPSGHPPHHLEQIARVVLHTGVQPLKGVIGSGRGYLRFEQLPPGRAGAYACHLADVAGAAWAALSPQLALAGLDGLYAEVDLPLADTLARMERIGIKVDPLRLATMERTFEEEKRRVAEQIHQLAGREFNVGSLKQLGQVLFEELKLPVLKKTKTGYSTDSETLEKLRPKHEIIDLVLRWRTLAKLIDTYTTVLSRAIDPRDGRVHTSFQQTVAVSGRLITTEPDLQRTPVRTGEFRQIREAFVAEPGWLLVSADWSQIELRVLAHVSQDPHLLAAYTAGRDVHRETAAELFGIPADRVTRPQRDVGKTVNFATLYGQGATALALQLGIPRKQAKEYIDRFFAHYEGVAAWKQQVVTDAYLHGYTTTIRGRRRYIPELQSNNFTDRAYGERIAANAPIQGSAADLCKMAMLAIDREILARGLRARLVLQVHDELVLEVPSEEVEALKELVRRHMEGVAQLSVPLAVDVGVGPTWAAAH
jgi:DNA polymerase-1